MSTEIFDQNTTEVPGEDEELSYPTLHTLGVCGRHRRRFRTSAFRVHNFRAHNIGVHNCRVHNSRVHNFSVHNDFRVFGFRHRGCLGFKILGEGLKRMIGSRRQQEQLLW